MKCVKQALAATLAVVLSVTLAVGCVRPPKTPTPTPTPPVALPQEILSARDAALTYLRQSYPQKAPAEGTAWTGRRVSPDGQIGSIDYEFESGKWLMRVGVPMLSPGVFLYEMQLANPDSGFRWEGKLDKHLAFLESNLGVGVDVLVVRDTVLAYVREQHAGQSPVRGMLWVGERTTPPDSVGHESGRFTAGDWTMRVEYDVAPPDQVLYRVELQDSASQFTWLARSTQRGWCSSTPSTSRAWRSSPAVRSHPGCRRGRQCAPGCAAFR